MKRRLAGVLATAVLAAIAPVATPVASAAPQDLPERSAEAVVLTGAQLPTWSQLPAKGVGQPYPGGYLDGVRDAHHGTVTRVPDVRKGASPEEIAAYRWNGSRFVQIPVQVDERFPYFLANANSDFAMYSGTDEELSYEWDVESWKKSAGLCNTAYPPGASAMQDPEINFDDDDEVSFMASDAGQQAPATASGPRNSTSERQEIRLADPRNPTAASYVYLFQKPGGSSFTRNSGYVRYQRDANADQWIDRSFFADGDPEKLGTSNTGYGPNISGTVCPDGTTPKNSSDRFPATASRYPPTPTASMRAAAGCSGRCA